MMDAGMRADAKRLCLADGPHTREIIEHMQGWQKREPWFYSKWIFNKYTYALLSAAVLCAVGFSITAFPVHTNVLAFVVGYFLSQFIFGWGHMTTHALYLETPTEKWEPGVLVAYLHHYSHPKEIYKNWLVHRLNFVMQAKGCRVAYFAVWFLPVLFFGVKLLPLWIWYLFWFSAIEPVHEYYHVPKNERRAHFSLPLYLGLRLLDVSGLLDEETHKEHHRHNRDQLGTVSKFYDLYCPFADTLFDSFWKTAIHCREKLEARGEEEPIRAALFALGSIIVPTTFFVSCFVFNWMVG
ncbi:hypothetical protein CMI37_32075 [Candidatus Pacearchaeota archaeon]|nr:hypothetical protein [Candidatus Pacearchaeota archaeon]